MKNKRKHWYRLTITECVLCGAQDKEKEKMYTPKPDDPYKRLIFKQTACSQHF